MLVAVVIFGVIAGVAYRTLDASLVARSRVTAEYAQWREVTRAMAAIERDLESLEQRPVKLGTGVVAPALVGVATVTGSVDPQSQLPSIALTRAGEPGATGKAAAPRRVAYRARQGALELLTWSALDQPAQSTPAVTVVANGITDVAFRYRDAAGRWLETWPPVSPNQRAQRPVPQGQVSMLVDTPLPVGVEVTLVLANGARVSRVIPIPARTSS